MISIRTAVLSKKKKPTHFLSTEGVILNEDMSTTDFAPLMSASGVSSSTPPPLSLSPLSNDAKDAFLEHGFIVTEVLEDHPSDPHRHYTKHNEPYSAQEFPSLGIHYTKHTFVKAVPFAYDAPPVEASYCPLKREQYTALCARLASVKEVLKEGVTSNNNVVLSINPVQLLWGNGVLVVIEEEEECGRDEPHSHPPLCPGLSLGAELLFLVHRFHEKGITLFDMALPSFISIKGKWNLRLKFGHFLDSTKDCAVLSDLLSAARPGLCVSHCLRWRMQEEVVSLFSSDESDGGFHDTPDPAGLTGTASGGCELGVLIDALNVISGGSNTAPKDLPLSPLLRWRPVYLRLEANRRFAERVRLQGVGLADIRTSLEVREAEADEAELQAHEEDGSDDTVFAWRAFAQQLCEKEAPTVGDVLCTVRRCMETVRGGGGDVETQDRGMSFGGGLTFGSLLCAGESGLSVSQL